MSNQSARLESILFVSGVPVSKKKLCETLGCSAEALQKITKELNQERTDSGVVIVDSGNHIALTTHPQFAEEIAQLQKNEVNAPLSKAAQETLSIIAYLGPISKIDLDFLRGVNTQYTLRRLAMKGLIQEQRDGRSKKVVITVEFLTHLGITSPKELPEYETIRPALLNNLNAIKQRMTEKE